MSDDRAIRIWDARASLHIHTSWDPILFTFAPANRLSNHSHTLMQFVQSCTCLGVPNVDGLVVGTGSNVSTVAQNCD
jgi:hypothetical protein